MKENGVIDKLVVFGVPNPERLKLSEIIENKIKVSALQFYSLNNSARSFENQIDYEMWAYPDGIKIYNDHTQILNDSQPQFSFSQPNDIISELVQNQKDNFMRQKVSYSSAGSFQNFNYPPDYIYSFVLTDYELQRTYCTCLSWHEKYFVKNNLMEANLDQSKQFNKQSATYQQYLKDYQRYSKALPKCKITTILNNPMILDPSVTLVYIPKSMIICSTGLACFQLQRKLLRYFYTSVIMPKRGLGHKDSFSFKIDETISDIFHKMCMNNGYSSAQRIFDNKRVTIHQKQQFIYQNHLTNQKILSVPKKKLKQFFIASFFLLEKKQKNLGAISQNGIPIASQINLQTAYSLPQYYEPYSQNSTLLPLPIQKIITLWKCLLLEKQILIFAYSQYESILLCQLLLYLLKPIKWQNIYIPFLPFHLSHHIEAIGGYLIGMSSIHMNYMIQNFDMKSKVFVDLKNKTILEEGAVDIIQLPQVIEKYLQTNLSALIKKYETQILNLQGNQSSLSYLLPFGQSRQPQLPVQIARKLIFIRSTLEMQQFFFNSIVYLFNNFIPFIEKRLQGVISFQTKEYLEILNDSTHRRFMKQISKTMVFIRLCQYHLQQSERCAFIQKTIGQLFVYSHDILSQKYVIKSSMGSNNLDNQKDIIKAWPLEQLLNPENKYYQYHNYLFEKNAKEISQLIKTMDLYFIQESKQNPQLESSSSIKIMNSNNQPSNNDLPQNSQQYLKKIQRKKRQIKWKRFGETDSQDLYEKAGKMFADLKLEKFLVKYIKYLELNEPKRVIKTISNERQKEQENKGWFGWLSQIIYPPVLSRAKQQRENKHKLRRKITEIGGIFNLALDLKKLFKDLKDSQVKQIKQAGSVFDLEERQNLYDSKQMIDFCEYHPENLRISKAHSQGMPTLKKPKNAK